MNLKSLSCRNDFMHFQLHYGKMRYCIKENSFLINDLLE